MEEKENILDVARQAIIDSVQDAVDSFEVGHRQNVAILTPPFSNFSLMPRDLHSKKGFNVKRHSISYFPDGEPLDDVTGFINIIEGCQHLYRMRIGGFAVLKKFIKDINDNEDRIYITIWNANAFRYLDCTMGIGKAFPLKIHIPELTEDEIRAAIMANYEDDEIQFEYDEFQSKENIIEWMPTQVRLFSEDREIKIPHIETSALRRAIMRRKVYLGADEKVFDQIHYLSRGNLGAAKEIWIRSLQYPIIRPTYVLNACKKFIMDNDEAFVAVNILRKGKVPIKELQEDLGDQVDLDKAVASLKQKGIIKAREDNLSIKAENLSFTLDSLAKNGMV